LTSLRKYNSTLSVKLKPCVGCGKMRPIFSKGRCQPCATVYNVLSREEREIEQDESLGGYIKQLDDVFSKYIRLKNADKEGNVTCFTSSVKIRWQDAHAGHFISRGCMYLRFDERNVHVQSAEENIFKHGNIPVYAKRLDEISPGLSDLLIEESRIIYHITRDELIAKISEYTNKLRKLKKEKGV